MISQQVGASFDLLDSHEHPPYYTMESGAEYFPEGKALQNTSFRAQVGSLKRPLE